MKEMWSKITLLSVSTLLSLVAAEGVIRWLLPPPQTVSIRKAVNAEMRRELENREGLLIKVSKSPEEARGYSYILTPTGRRLRANIHTVIENHRTSGGRRIDLVTNSLGYRNREIGPKQGKRLVFLGDSITLGDYLQEEETFVRLIEKMARSQELDWETINTGVSGIRLKEELAILIETGLDLEPDVVVLGFFLNDFRTSPGVFVRNLPPLAKHSRLLYYLLRDAFLARPDTLDFDPQNMLKTRNGEEYHDALPKLYRREISRHEKIVRGWKETFTSGLRARGERSPFYREVIKWFSAWGGAWSPEMWRHVRPLFVELKRLSVEHNFRLFFVCFPVRCQVEDQKLFDYPQQQLSRLSHELDVPYLDLLPVFRSEHRRQETPLYYDHAHQTPAGNRLIAESVYRFLSEQL